jgi:hypothetical protein
VRIATAAVWFLTLLTAACGGDPAPSDEAGAPPSGTLEALWRAPGADVGVLAGTSDHAPGRNRVSFLVVRPNGAVVERPRARIWLARGRRAEPFARGEARLLDVGVPGRRAGMISPTTYVAHLDLPAPGTYWFLAEPVGARPRIQALGTLVVKARTASPAVGERPPASRTPTLADVGGDAARISTGSPPARALLRSSVAEALRDRVPFVVVFATPRFCTSRTCGPTVDVVESVRRRVGRGDVRFIHVEIYRDLDPNKGYNRWFREWGLPSEPWTFLVGSNGRVAAKFEGPVAASELEAAVRRLA